MYTVFNPAIPLLDITPTKVNADVPQNTCTGMFVVALFIIGPNWKSPKYPATVEWIKKFWSVQYNGIIQG